MRDRLRALVTAHRTRAVHAALCDAGPIDLHIGALVVTLDGGRIGRVAGDLESLPPPVDRLPAEVLDPAVAAESLVIGRWLTRYPDRWSAPGAEQLLEALRCARQLDTMTAPSRSIASS